MKGTILDTGPSGKWRDGCRNGIKTVTSNGTTVEVSSNDVKHHENDEHDTGLDCPKHEMTFPSSPKGPVSTPVLFLSPCPTSEFGAVRRVADD
jgi:hypothetical protein